MNKLVKGLNTVAYATGKNEKNVTEKIMYIADRLAPEKLPKLIFPLSLGKDSILTHIRDDSESIFIITFTKYYNIDLLKEICNEIRERYQDKYVMLMLNDITHDYVAFILDKSNHMEILFQKIPAHSGVLYNEKADKLAKKSSKKKNKKVKI